MASSANNWSVVGKSKKGTKQPTLTKTQKKHFIENMPRIEALGNQVFLKFDVSC